MKKAFYLLSFLASSSLAAQTAFYNSGQLQIHQNGQIGFHTSVINNGIFDTNLGLAGFYGDNYIAVDGALSPVLYDTEIANSNGVYLNIPLVVSNNVNFITGDFLTQKNVTDQYLQFLADSFYVGATDDSKVNGFVSVTGQSSFLFPVGDTAQLRGLYMDSASSGFSRCAYFFENPNNPTSITDRFNTDDKIRDLGFISETEFWVLENEGPANVNISWNSRSNMGAIASGLEEITIAGYHISSRRWLEIGVTAISGDMIEGFAISNNFNPNDYAAITFATIAVPQDILELDNYLLTPNGDGYNDVLVIDGMELSPNNYIKIYNRAGLKVYEKSNYTNEFNGFANVNGIVPGRGNGLPNGVYFYIVRLEDLDMNFQGFLYLTR